MNGLLRRIDSKRLPKSIDLLKWANREDFSGYDPYDGLNLPILNDFPFLKKKYLMILITQFFKNFPVNLRPFLGIKKERNAKGIALFVSGLLNLYGKERDEKFLKLAITLIDWLIENRSPYTEKYAWGYNFPWQSRNSYKPRYFPNIVTTSFVANSFIDAYEYTGDSEYLEIAVSSADFIANELNMFEDQRGICFSYSPSDNERVYNATLLGSWLLLRTWRYTGNAIYLEYGNKSVEFVINSQNCDGSWFYGDDKNQKWIDNFHTGYNLWFLFEIDKINSSSDIKNSSLRGFDYYLNNLFTKDMIPKYFPNKLYPIDIHSVAVVIVVLSKFGKKSLSEKIFKTTSNLFYSQKGYYHYRKTPLYTIKIPYMRWSNAWMFYALTEMEKHENLD
ncbi:delta-aminolevulinic acid dehydratase [candidate division WOR-3 bacterium]|nr:delta-aminolevulinic acid dehydratase [candidate division WOR-3 bacterium]